MEPYLWIYLQQLPTFPAPSSIGLTRQKGHCMDFFVNLGECQSTVAPQNACYGSYYEPLLQEGTQKVHIGQGCLSFLDNLFALSFKMVVVVCVGLVYGLMFMISPAVRFGVLASDKGGPRLLRGAGCLAPFMACLMGSWFGWLGRRSGMLAPVLHWMLVPILFGAFSAKKRNDNFCGHN